MEKKLFPKSVAAGHTPVNTAAWEVKFIQQDHSSRAAQAKKKFIRPHLTVNKQM
jgi:hypothetical protein